MLKSRPFHALRRLAVRAGLATLLGAAACSAPDRESPAPAAAVAHHATVSNGAVIGSGFALAPGLVATNAHVVAGRQPGERVKLRSTASGVMAEAVLLHVSDAIDVAFLAAPSDLLPVVPDGAARSNVGGQIRGVGIRAVPTPRQGAIEPLDGMLLVSGVEHPAFGPGMIGSLPDATLGYSGGPVFDDQGLLVGMIAAVRPDPAGALIDGRTDQVFIIEAGAIRAESLRASRVSARNRPAPVPASQFRLGAEAPTFSQQATPKGKVP